MSLQFIQSRPLQAGKLVAVVVTLPFASGVVYGLVPDQGLAGLFLVPLLGLGLALVVAAETLFAGYRSIRSGSRLTDRLEGHPTYSIVRVVEVVLVVLSSGAFAYIVGTLPEGPMAGPGAIGLWMMMVGLGLLIIGGSLLRTLTEYYYCRLDSPA